MDADHFGGEIQNFVGKASEPVTYRLMYDNSTLITINTNFQSNAMISYISGIVHGCEYFT